MCRPQAPGSSFPLPPFGTMGAVIFMRSVGRSRKELFDIGIAGPLAGLACLVGWPLGWALAAQSDRVPPSM